MGLELQTKQLGTHAQQGLGVLSRTQGTLYVQNGVIKESKFSLGRAFLGLFSSTIRAENRAAMNAVSQAMEQVYGQRPAVRDLRHINAARITAFADTAKTANRARMDSFMQTDFQRFGTAAHQGHEALRASETYQDGLAPEGKILETQDRTESQFFAILGDKYRAGELTVDQMSGRLETIPRFKALLDQHAGVGDRDFTIRKHTEQVLAQFEDQKAHYNLDRLEQSMRQTPGFGDFDAELFMKTVLLFHDIGKGQAHAEGRPADQHAFTVPVMQEAMKKMGFSEQAVRLATNLVDNDLLGEWQVGKRHDVGKVRSGLRELAQDSGVSPRDFLTMQKLFYISDASSYAPIRNAFMETLPNGKLRFTENKTDELLVSLHAEHGNLGVETGQLLLSPAGLAQGTHPLGVFNQDFSGKSYNVYDVSRFILNKRDSLQRTVDRMPNEIRDIAQARLDEAVEMANCALVLNADRWTPEHARGVIAARMEIRAAGIPELLPAEFSGASGDQLYSGNLTGLDQLRAPEGATDKFYALVDAKGGNAHMLQGIGQCQVVSSWCPTSLAVKGYLNKNRAVSEEHYFMATRDQYGAVTDKPAECYDRFAHAPAGYWTGLCQRMFGQDWTQDGTSTGHLGRVYDAAGATRETRFANGGRAPDTAMFDTSIQYQMAMQMEMLSRIDFPGNDRANGQLTIHRVEYTDVLGMYGIDATQPGSTGTMKRGAYDAGSVICPVLGAGGIDATEQVIPYHRIVNSFFLGARTSQQGARPDESILIGNMQREILFMSDGLTVTYTGNGNSLVNQFTRSAAGAPAAEASAAEVPAAEASAAEPPAV